MKTKLDQDELKLLKKEVRKLKDDLDAVTNSEVLMSFLNFKILIENIAKLSVLCQKILKTQNEVM